MNINKIVLGISGSVREYSSNTVVLNAIANLLPINTEYIFYKNLLSIPPFNPDEDNEIASVKELRDLVSKADLIIICTPEYAFGVPGVLKNALDWLVQSGEFNEKLVFAISVSPLGSGGEKCLLSLAQTLTALGTQINTERCLSIPIINSKLNQQKEIIDQELILQFQKMIDSLQW